MAKRFPVCSTKRCHPHLFGIGPDPERHTDSGPSVHTNSLLTNIP